MIQEDRNYPNVGDVVYVRRTYLKRLPSSVQDMFPEKRKYFRGTVTCTEKGKITVRIDTGRHLCMSYPVFRVSCKKETPSLLYEFFVLRLEEVRRTNAERVQMEFSWYEYRLKELEKKTRKGRS